MFESLLTFECQKGHDEPRLMVFRVGLCCDCAVHIRTIGTLFGMTLPIDEHFSGCVHYNQITTTHDLHEQTQIPSL